MSATILIAGGGTGGHVFPGLAVADALIGRADVKVVFCGTARGLEVRAVPPSGHGLELLQVEPMQGGGVARVVRGGAVATVALGRSLALLRRLRPVVVLSVGGYAAGPVALAAATMGIRLAVMEPNAAFGLTNRVLAPLAARAYLAWPPEGSAAWLVRGDAQRVVGVPLRAGFRPSPYAASTSARLLVLGGSQGAAPLNARMPEVAARLASTVPALEVVHQAGRDKDDQVRAAYTREGFTRVTVTPFVDDVAGEITRADVVVARSGAGSVAELSAIGRAALLVPFPLAADDHQAKNAEALAAVGGAVVVRQEAADAVRLARELGELFIDADRRQKMANAARAAGRPDAARVIAEDLLALSGQVERGAA